MVRRREREKVEERGKNGVEGDRIGEKEGEESWRKGKKEGRRGRREREKGGESNSICFSTKSHREGKTCTRRLIVLFSN